MMNLEKFYNALLFAIRAHQGQKMKFPSDVDYSAHIFGVALTTFEFAKDENVNMDLVVSVALLHDTIEDTGVTYEDIKREFSKEIADGVLALTKNEALPKEQQMEDCLNRILRLDKKEIAIVKLADRCFNTRCRVENWSVEKQEKYINEAINICDKIGFYCLPLKNKILANISKIKDCL